MLAIHASARKSGGTGPPIERRAGCPSLRDALRLRPFAGCWTACFPGCRVAIRHIQSFLVASDHRRGLHLERAGVLRQLRAHPLRRRSVPHIQVGGEDRTAEHKALGHNDLALAGRRGGVRPGPSQSLAAHAARLARPRSCRLASATAAPWRPQTRTPGRGGAGLRRRTLSGDGAAFLARAAGELLRADSRLGCLLVLPQPQRLRGSRRERCRWLAGSASLPRLVRQASALAAHDSRFRVGRRGLRRLAPCKTTRRCRFRRTGAARQ